MEWVVALLGNIIGILADAEVALLSQSVEGVVV